MRCVVTKSMYAHDDNLDIADATFDEAGDGSTEQFGLMDLTTPGSFWLNPPLPMDENGDWIFDGEIGDGLFRKTGSSTFIIEPDST